MLALGNDLWCFVGKRKKENKGKKERIPRQKLLKGCHESLNVTVLAILERLLEFRNFSCQPTMVAGNIFQCSMAPPLWNPFPRSCLYFFIGINLMAYFFSIHSLSYELEQVTYLSLTVGVRSHFKF